jgi:Reverse transcriptase (RNA-dependent DNA polymerase).
VGVPQGSILGPIFFSIFINDISSVFKFCKYHLYADDLQLYIETSVDNIAEAIFKMNEDLEALRAWTTYHGIIPNPNKFQSIIIGSTPLLYRLTQCQIPPIIFNTEIIPFSSTVKNLGLFFDADLQWNSQVVNVGTKVFRKFHSLKRLKRFLPRKTKQLLCTSLIFPVIEYAGVVMSNITQTLINKLQTYQNACVRYTFGLKKFDHVSQHRKALQWLPIDKRLEHQRLGLLWRIFEGRITSIPTLLISYTSRTT